MMTTPVKSHSLINQNSQKEFFVQTDLHGHILAANNAFSDQVALEPSEFLQHCVFEFLKDPSVTVSCNSIGTLLAEHAPGELTTTLVSAKSTPIAVQWKLNALDHANGKEMLVLWTGNRISTSQNDVPVVPITDVYKSLFANSPQPMWIYDTENFRFLDVNKAALELYGYLKPAFMALEIDSIQQDTIALKPLVEINGKSNWVHRKKDGSQLQVEIQTHHFQYYHQAAVLVVITDVTEKRYVQIALQESEERFRRMAETAPVMIWISDEKDKTIYVNKSWTDFTGVPASEALKDDGWLKLIHPDDISIGIDEYKLGFQRKKPVSLVYRLKYRTGEYRWVLDNAVPRFLEDGSFVGFIGSVVDIHYRKLNEEKIRFQANLIENVSDIIISTDINFNIVTWNKPAAQTYGIKAEVAVHKNIMQLLPHHFPGTTPTDAIVELKENGIWKGELVFTLPESDPVYLLCTISAIRNEENEVTGYVSVSRDVTAKMRAEEALKKSELFYKSLIADSLHGIVLADIAGNIQFVAPSIKNILGYKPEELAGTNIFTKVYSEDVGFAKEAFNDESTYNSKNQSITIRIKKKDGHWLWCTIRGHNLLKNEYVNAIVIYFSDDTRRKEMEEALKESEKSFRLLSENAPTIIQRLDKKLRITYCNQTFTKITGLSVDYILGRTPGEAGLNKAAMQQYARAARKVFKNKSTEVIKIEHARANGTIWSFLVTMAPEINEDANVESILAISSNITEMTQVQELLITKEEELLHSNERFELASKASTDSIWEINLESGYVYITAEFTKQFGYTIEDIKGKDSQWFIERLHPEDRLSVISKITQGFGTRDKLWKDEFRWRSKSGDYTYIHNRAYIFYDENEKPYRAIGAIQDITNRKKAESQLIQKDILLAASAHAANELLTRIPAASGIIKSLQIIGAATKVDRTYIFQYCFNAANKEYYFKQLQEWNSGKYESHKNNLELQYVPEAAYPEIYNCLKEGHHNDLLFKPTDRPALRKHIRSRQIKSMLLVPIFVQNNFWGLVGFDQCSYERTWMNMELDILKAFASNLAGVFEREEGERKLMESEIKFKSLFQNSLDVVTVLDNRTKIKYITPSVTTVLGYEESELIGKNGFDLVHPEDNKRLKKLAEDLMAHPELNAVMDVRILDKQQKWVWVEAKGVNKLSDPIINGTIFNFHDISDRKQSEQQLQGYSEHITSILNSITDGFIALDNNANILWWNPIAEQLTGIKDVNVLGKNIWDALPILSKTKAPAEYDKAIKSKTGLNFELYIENLKVFFDINAYPSQQGLFVYFKDISFRKNQEMLLSLEKEVLELNTNPTATLKSTVDYFLSGMEKLNPGIICSVLLLEEDGKHIRQLSAPTLSPKFSKALDGLEIGPKVGSCGTAMYLKKVIIVSDIKADPLWENYRTLAAESGLAACWSFPIVTTSNAVLGSFAGYYKTIQAPTEEQIQFFNRAATLLGVIIDNKQAEQKISISNERYLLATKATNDTIWDYDIKQRKTYWGESFYTQFGYKSEDHAGVKGFWESRIHPDERAIIKERYENALNIKERGVVYSEYRFLKANNKYALVADRAFIVYDSNGEPVRFVGSMQDITERRKLEERLLKQEINKQKTIAQAVVDAQEKERAEIGKELHDNVNQILSTAKLYLELAKTDAKQRDELIKRSSDSIFNAINEIRHISKALVPPSVKDLGLIDSIKDLVESLRMTGALEVKFVYAGEFDSIISDKQKLMLFRIIQEQVNNVLKHAEASKIIISIKQVDKIISLSIEDNGKGFEPEKIKFKKGVGISNIESRAGLFNGKVTITTAPQKGCRLLIQVPIHE